MKRAADALRNSDFWDLCRRAGMTCKDFDNCGIHGFFLTGLESFSAALAIRRALKAGNFSRCLDAFAEEPCVDIRDFIARVNAAVAGGC